MQAATHGGPHRLAWSRAWRAWWRVSWCRLYLASPKRLSIILAVAFMIALCLQVLQQQGGGALLLAPLASRLAFHAPDPAATPSMFLGGKADAAPAATTPPLLHLKAKVDNLTRDRLAEDVARVYNLPDRYGEEHPPPLSGRRSCGTYPRLVDLSFNNLYWQMLHSSNGTFYLYSAFFDNRTRTAPATSVRILAMADRLTPAVVTHCQLWYAGEAAPVTARVVEYRYIWVRAYGNYRQGILQPYLLQCVVPAARRHHVPLSVSLVEAECDRARNNLRVVHELPPPGEQKRDFAVCVKGLDIGADISLRIVEWLELLFLLGADKVFMYDLGVHPNVSRVLRHYEAEGRVDLRTLTLPGDQPNARGLVRPFLRAKITSKRQNELIPYNDCLYRNKDLYRLVVLLDIDEVIMPRATPDWRQLMRQLAPEAMAGLGNPYSSYYARHVYFLDGMQEAHGWTADAPRFMHMLQHLHRARNYTGPGSYVKAFHDPQRVLTLHNHFPFSCLPGGCRALSIPTEAAHLQHYRSDCVGELRGRCPDFRNHTVREDAILRFKEPLIQGVLRTLRRLGFLPR
ncbi:uncharacterized protein LOC127003037 [Eriocheir sinensis]|uniref:uncharacterized protein LOC127003037 n=1 Tax=Eriocheir sinensis TaxID=95602 RepID=UPI0021C74770|nr:uncharacterized protein LOC127003037 [Eriocheir sinensis]XP_050725351.1 uncharacterized protein LOC127003037 [Eriocheir sinensis]XP_050725352.1 uncharacterized protein LOC127003037 [Eriocheir sinensis]XP_050725353.1 uncharacterized protein LOC127003037 [Eriocheir sinensis]XP_050725354.1 uncharacterized protein LOC127003037 [Eriocheir sinensis]